MDIQKVIKELLEKITEDEKLQESFMKNGIKTVEKLLNIDLPDDQIEKIAKGIAAKLDIDDISGLLKGGKDGKFDAEDAKDLLEGATGLLSKFKK